MKSLFRLRKLYVFDHPLDTLDLNFKFVQLFAFMGERLFYVKGGVNGGIRMLVYYDEYDVPYTANRLHADTLVERSHQIDEINATLRMCANDCEPVQMLEPGRVPGFIRGDGVVCHEQGWFTRSRIVLPLSAPRFAPDANVYDIREGIYVYFPDKSIRLIRRADYYSFVGWAKEPIARQGDLLFFGGYFSCYGPRPHNVLRFYDGALHHGPDGTLLMNDSDNWLDNHEFDTRLKVVRHREHGELPFPAQESWYACLVPGTSRPFVRGRELD